MSHTLARLAATLAPPRGTTGSVAFTCVLCGRGAGGKVNKVDADFIGLLVLGVFNAAIARQNIRPQYSFRAAVRPASLCCPRLRL